MKLTEEQKKNALELSGKMAGDFDQEKAEAFAKKHSDKSWYGKFRLLLDMIKDSEFKIRYSSWVKMAGAIAYCVFPMDIIPDFIPLAGWLDDAFVLKMVVDTFSDEIQRYKQCSETNESNTE